MLYMAEGGKEPLNSRSDWLESPSLVLGRWKRRWVELTDQAILFYSDDPRETLTKTQSLLVLSIGTDEIKNVTGPETDAFVLTLHMYNGRNYKLKCYTKERASAWRKDLNYRCRKKDK